MNDYVHTIIYCLECSTHRLNWYKDTGEKRYLEDSDNYLKVAAIYMKEITNQ